MNRLYQKILVLTLFLNKSALELKEPKNEYYNSSMPAISEKENMPIEVEEHMDLKTLKSDVLDPVWESFLKLAKSKYIIKIGEQEGAGVVLKLIKEVNAIHEDQCEDWAQEDDRKEQRECKIRLIYSIWEIIGNILKNDKIRNSVIDSETIDILIDLLIWCDKYKSQPQEFTKIYDILLNILWDTIYVKSGKYFIPSGYITDMEKVKKTAISHGVLALLYNTFELASTDFTTKRIINTKIINHLEVQDISDQIEIISYSIKNKREEIKSDSKILNTPSKVNKLSVLAQSDDKTLEIMGSGFKSTSPKHSSSFLTKGIVNANITKILELPKILELLEKLSNNLELKQTKAKIDDETRKKKHEELKSKTSKNKDKRFKAKRLPPLFTNSDAQDGELNNADNDNKLTEDASSQKSKIKTDLSKAKHLERSKRDNSKKAQRKKRTSSSELGHLKSKGHKNKGLSLYQTGKAIVFQ